MSSPEAPSEHSDALHSDEQRSDNLPRDARHGNAAHEGASHSSASKSEPPANNEACPTLSSELDGTLVSGRSDLLARALQYLDEPTADDLLSLDALELLEFSDSHERIADLSGPDKDDAPTRDLNPPPALEGDAWQVGAHIGGRYQLIEEVAAGAWGRVWKATQAGVRRPVAVKVLKSREAQSLGNARSRFVREARLASRVRHPSAVRVVDFGYEGQDPYLVMEWLDGVTLAEVLRDAGPAPIELVLGLGRDICAALHFAHEEGVIHRDLKPSNVMLVETSTGVTPVVVDFGLARTFAEDEPTVTRADVVVGTPAYMSPETIQGHALDPTSDIYSLGVTLIEALMGINPFRGASSAETMTKHLLPRPIDAETLAANGCTPEIAALLLSMVEIDPSDRPACAWALSQRFDAALRAAHAPVRTEPEAPALDAFQLVTLPPSATSAKAQRRGIGGPLRFAAIPAVALLAMAMIAMVTQRTQHASDAEAPPANAADIATQQGAQKLAHLALHEDSGVTLGAPTSAALHTAFMLASDAPSARPTLAAYTPTPAPLAVMSQGDSDPTRHPGAPHEVPASQAHADAATEAPPAKPDEDAQPAEAIDAAPERSPTTNARRKTHRTERRARDGELVLTLAPPALVRVNGESHGERSSLVLRELPYGRYEIELTRDGVRSRHHVTIRDSSRRVLRL